MAITMSLQADEQRRSEDERKAKERRAAEVQAPVHSLTSSCGSKAQESVAIIRPTRLRHR